VIAQPKNGADPKSRAPHFDVRGNRKDSGKLPGR